MSFYRAVLAGAIILSALPLHSNVLDFEGFSDGTILTNQYLGIIFSNAEIITAGISLNELEFPPHSGVNVAFDDGGPITIVFSTPVVSVGGYFNYLEPLTLTGLDAMGDTVASAISLYSTNDALFGDPGSSPNELISISSPGGISSVTAEADPNGGSFTLDDLTYQPQSSGSPSPEPASIWLILAVLVSVFGFRAYAHR